MKPVKVFNITLPNKPLSNFELEDAAKQLKIKNFSGVFLRDNLLSKPLKNECGILNLDTSEGTHWVAWYKKNNTTNDFSYGIQPPLEFENYMDNDIYYSSQQIQKPNQVICGHLCLHFLKCFSNGMTFDEMLNSLH